MLSSSKISARSSRPREKRRIRECVKNLLAADWHRCRTVLRGLSFVFLHHGDIFEKKLDIMNKFKSFLIRIANYINVDGLLHITVSALIILFFGGFLSLYASAIIAVVVGIAKEMYDYFSRKGTAELHDVICDLIGIALGSLIWLLY